MGAALKFKHTAVPRQHGETARAKVVRGPDYGAVYVFTGPKVSIGRGEDNDIMISDLKASRRHAEFTAGPNGWSVKDLGSANGIEVNGKNTRAANLQTKDTIALGETVLEFVAPEAGTLVLLAPPRTIEQVQSDQKALEEQKRKVASIARIGSARPGFPAAAQAGGAPDAAAEAAKKKRVLLIGGAALLGLLMMMSGGNNNGGKAPVSTGPKKGDKPRVTTLDDLAKFLPGSEPGPIRKSADGFFRVGFREYKSKNYLRAKQQFETVLQMIPGDPLATRYLDAVQKEIQDEVEQRLSAGANSCKAEKVRDARGQYEAVIRLLYWNPTDPKYIQAKEELKRIDQRRLEGKPCLPDDEDSS